MKITTCIVGLIVFAAAPIGIAYSQEHDHDMEKVPPRAERPFAPSGMRGGPAGAMGREGNFGGMGQLMRGNPKLAGVMMQMRGELMRIRGEEMAKRGDVIRRYGERLEKEGLK